MINHIERKNMNIVFADGRGDHQESSPQQPGALIGCPTTDCAPGQPDMKHYRIWFWCEDYGATVYKVQNDRDVSGRFYDNYGCDDYGCDDYGCGDYGCGDLINSYVPVRVDNLTEMKDDRPLNEISWDEFFAMAREAKELHLARLEKVRLAQQDPGSQQPVKIDSCWPLDGTPGQLTRYRIWFWSREVRWLMHEAENAEQVEEWFQASRPEHETDLTTYCLERLEEIDMDEADRLKKRQEYMLPRANESKPLGAEPKLVEGDFFGELKKRRDELRAQRERQS
jgi:hypothetical protein